MTDPVYTWNDKPVIVPLPLPCEMMEEWHKENIGEWFLLTETPTWSTLET